MPRTYRKSTRARTHEATRRRILAAAAASINAGEFGVREIADRAGVTVQTIYAHFNSKAGLITSVVQDASATHGLVEGMARVSRQETPQGRLDAMVRATFDFWHRAWWLISFMLTARRQDEEFAAQVRHLDATRLADLLEICEELEKAGELRSSLKPKTAAALVFTFTTPYIYEELVESGRLSYATAMAEVIETVDRAILRKP